MFYHLSKGSKVACIFCVILCFWTLPNVAKFIYQFVPNLNLRILIGLSLYFLLPYIYFRAIGFYLAVFLDAFVFSFNDR